MTERLKKVLPPALLFLIIEITVAIALELGVSNLILKFTAHTFILLRLCKTAGTVSAGTLEPLLH